ncbi:MAG: TraM recognition domain-containing protein [Alphaproteobacteria bacterium]|nr:TraM recognition domain-containing protein [Alphaproteobacteria bacterium]MCL2505152.1 TraM recognition domain-containing protein [Alphaproteobacteria bacterium]
MPVIIPKHQANQRAMFRDVRPLSQRFASWVVKPDIIGIIAMASVVALFMAPPVILSIADILTVPFFFFFRWALKHPFRLPLKIPKYANMPDPNNSPPGKTSAGWSDGILFIGNVRDKDDDFFNYELWLTNTDARTHILYLGTTGSGKTEGLKSLVTNALCWGSGFAYTDGKADTDLWASLYSLARRFGRDDDMLVLNYMTGNSDDGSTSNSMNPFANGSASYLANLVVNLMPDAGGDNAMWKERAVALMFALMPALTFKRDKQGMLLDVGVVRDHLELKPIIQLSRDKTLPDRILHGLEGYLNTLPGYVAEAFDDDGNERPPSPDQPMYDLQVARQQHGYLSMQFTRAMQSLADEYGYIFKAQLADIDVLDVVLNRRILAVLIPALEKSSDEAANLGKIVAGCLKGMMGATLGNTVEGSWEMTIGNKQTRSASSFMTVFDEVGYYTASGMAVMAAQARSLGFSLVFASQDLPSMEKRVKQEAKSIAGNCNLKIFGRIEDPTDTKTFVENHGGTSWVIETGGFSAPTNTISSLFTSMPFQDNRSSGALLSRQRVAYDHLRGQTEGQAHVLMGDWAYQVQMFYAVPERARALRVHRMLPVPGTSKSSETRDRVMTELIEKLGDSGWTAATALPTAKPLPEITAIANVLKNADKTGCELGVLCVASGTGLAKKPAAGDSQESRKPVKSGFTDYSEEDEMDATPVAVARSNGEAAEEDYYDEGFDDEDTEFYGFDSDDDLLMPSMGKGIVIDWNAVKLSEDAEILVSSAASSLNAGLRGTLASEELGINK